MTEKENRLILNVSITNEEFEKKIESALDDYVNNIKTEHIDEKIARLVDKRIKYLFGENKYVDFSQRSFAGTRKTLEEYIRDKVDERVEECVNEQVGKIIAEELTKFMRADR